MCVSRGTGPDVPEAFAAAVGDAVGDQHQLAISRPRRGPGGIVRSYQEARSTLDLAAQLGLSAPLVHAADVLVFKSSAGTAQPSPTWWPPSSAGWNKHAAVRNRS